jgi:hypothetical protein
MGGSWYDFGLTPSPLMGGSWYDFGLTPSPLMGEGWGEGDRRAKKQLLIL